MLIQISNWRILEATFPITFTWNTFETRSGRWHFCNMQVAAQGENKDTTTVFVYRHVELIMTEITLRRINPETFIKFDDCKMSLLIRKCRCVSSSPPPPRYFQILQLHWIQVLTWGSLCVVVDSEVSLCVVPHDMFIFSNDRKGR